MKLGKTLNQSSFTFILSLSSSVESSCKTEEKSKTEPETPAFQLWSNSPMTSSSTGTQEITRSYENMYRELPTSSTNQLTSHKNASNQVSVWQAKTDFTSTSRKQTKKATRSLTFTKAA